MSQSPAEMIRVPAAVREAGRFHPTKPLAQVILERWQDSEWSLQGLGMLRTYVSKTMRMHVWDSRYRVPGVTMLHTHPWDFESLIVAGAVRQYRYEIAYTGTRPDPLPGVSDDAFFESIGFERYVEGTIVCGEGGGECEPPTPVYLRRGEAEVYGEGEMYRQDADEIHESLPDDGTVTLINRTFRANTEVAHVYWPHGGSWVSAEPRPATPEEVETIVTASLERWFQ